GKRKALWRHPLIRALKNARLKTSIEAHSPMPAQRNGSGRETDTLIEMRDVTIAYNSKPILRDLNWSMRLGEHWALLGPNGSGKTTLLSLIQGDNPQAYAQNIRLFGISPDSTQALWQARQFIGSLSPELHLHYPTDWACLDVVASGFFD